MTCIKFHRSGPCTYLLQDPAFRCIEQYGGFSMSTMLTRLVVHGCVRENLQHLLLCSLSPGHVLCNTDAHWTASSSAMLNSRSQPPAAHHVNPVVIAISLLSHFAAACASRRPGLPHPSSVSGLGEAAVATNYHPCRRRQRRACR